MRTSRISFETHPRCLVFTYFRRTSPICMPSFTPANGHASSLYTYTRVRLRACSAGFEFKFSKTKYHRPARFSFFEPSSQASPPRGTILICNQKFACAAAGRAPPSLSPLGEALLVHAADQRPAYPLEPVLSFELAAVEVN